MNWNRGAGGGGAIDLVIHLHHLDFKAAVDWLAQPLSGRPAARTSASRRRLQLCGCPPPDPSQARARPAAIWSSNGACPQAARAAHPVGHPLRRRRANAVFLLLEKKTTPSAPNCAAPRQRPWRGLAPGSQKDLGFFAIPADPAASASSSASRPSTPSVALPSIPTTAASPPPAPDPTHAGCRLCSTKATRSTAASMPTPPATPWLTP